MGTHIAWMFILLAVPGALADSQYYMNGNLDRVESNDNYTSCTFSVNGKTPPSEVHDKQFCNFLLQALQHKTPVSVTVKTVTHALSADEYQYSVNFHNRKAVWAGDKLETASFKYQLVGSVEDVYYTNGNCNIAVDTGYDVRNDKQFHVTSDHFLCEKAIEAFHLGNKVTMVASVDTTPKYSNNILLIA